MASSSHLAFRVNCCLQRPSVSDNFHRLKTSLSSTFKPFLRELEQLSLRIDVSKAFFKNTSLRLLDVFVDSMFEFVDQPLLPSQSNFAPVDELKETVLVTNIEGKVPNDFPEGVYVRNGPNPLFGGLKSAVSMFGRSSHIWVEGEGMLHVLYFDKARDGSWTVTYKNKYVESETFELEKQRNKPSFLPAIEGSSPAILSAYLLNLLRFGKVNKYLSNTNVFEHSGKYYSVAENHMPQEINMFTLETLGNWDVNGAWDRPFTSHPKRAPDTGELVIIGVDATKPFMQLGIVSADGKRLVHKVDLKFNRCSLTHDVGLTRRYNVIMDFPLILDIQRLLKGGPLIKYDKAEYARIGIMPRYADADSIKWFQVESSSTFHLLNCFEDGHQVVVRACRALDSIIPGPDMGVDKFEWFSRRLKQVESVDEYSSDSEDGSLFSRCCEWRLNMKTGDVKERYLTGTEFSMDFPSINGNFTGVKNKYGYTQVIDCSASSDSGMAKYGGLAKLHFEEPDTDYFVSVNQKDGQYEELIKVDYHKFEQNTFCTGAAFVPKPGSHEEDDGWIITFVHNEETNMSKAYIIDTRRFTSEPVAKITLPCRVPYGFHGAFMPILLGNLTASEY
ncbi:PREDICTED: carotenoid 9,10(9',10')-cleavage dioxygenase 1-like [Populus euphratica]|uniref:Carotenoid 9,10(9',10')-cleavage dioxygenase 1-like n=1 Tax=Populus euphratica TaxID=75702 RepID=A0AAJ6XII2_POPEU|nr:PREDICTED: carotenoid 9,10(9',10')-cleavage dioxygenase 1-like [Populus euphratica]